MNRFFDTATIFITGIVLFAIACGAYIYIHATRISSGSDTTSPALTAANRASTTAIGPSQSPDRLLIPKIGVNAHIQYVGIAKTGNMAVPTNYTDVGWYKLGTVPGQVGSAVIDGHVDNGFGKAAVFKQLSELAPGDDLYVQTQNGSRLHFIVRDAQIYPVTEVPLQKVFNQNDMAHLTLITCTGDFDKGKLEYNQRRVVYAELAS